MKYQKNTKSGDMKARIRNSVVADEFGCWIWQLTVDKGGYGKIQDKKTRLAHRVSYEAHKGTIEKGMTIHHKCSKPSCVNPEHLEQMSLRDNILLGRTGRNLLKTHCPHGHPYDKENTYMLRGKWRRCRICVRKATNAWHEKRRVIINKKDSTAVR